MKIKVLVTFLLYAIASAGQEFGTHWITYPEPDDTSTVWFRQTYIHYQKPKNALITYESTGHVIVYFNERRLSPDFNKLTDNSITSSTIDVTRYLRPDSNIIAVFYAPGNIRHSDKQLSLCFYGQYKSGRRFYYKADNNWLCKKGHIVIKDGIETVDRRRYDHRWTSLNENLHGWKNAVSSMDRTLYPIRDDRFTLHKSKTGNIIRPELIYQNETGDTLIYDFGRSFEGLIRLTIRNAKYGETINIGDLRYICDGSIDEQACRIFTVNRQKVVQISGSSSFNKSQIQVIEGLEILPYRQKSYLY